VAEDGTVSDHFQIASYFIAVYSVTATGQQTGRVARMTFTDADGSTNKVYQHWADQIDQPGGPSWQGDILNAGSPIISRAKSFLMSTSIRLLITRLSRTEKAIRSTSPTITTRRTPTPAGLPT